MATSRIKFVFLFLVFAFGFLFAHTLFLGQRPDSFFGSESQVAWQSVISTILFPVKAILMGPLLPFIEFLQQDPDTPPPFFLVGFAMYWTLLAVAIHYLYGKMRRA